MTTAKSPAERAATRRVRIRKWRGDDRYSWALFVDGCVTFSGMDQAEAQWRRRKAIKNLTEGRRWQEDAS